MQRHLSKMVFIKLAITWIILMKFANAQEPEAADEGSSRHCFGGIMSYEKTSGVVFKVPSSQVLIASSDQAVTPDCAALCRQSNSCIAFTVEYKSGRCQAFDRDSVGRRDLLRPQIGINYLEEVCYRGVSNYSNICGNRIWAFERIIGAFIEGFDDKEEKNVVSKVDCERLCLTEASFICRSAEYDELRQLCRMSREDRRTQPGHFKLSPASSVDYLENQCLKPKPMCHYELKPGVGVLSLDDLQYASNTNECEKTCDQTHLFSCWAYAFDSRQSRCYLSGDDTAGPSADGSSLPIRPGFIYGERKCIADVCTTGIMTYEKISAHTLRSALHELVLTNTVGQGITLDCLQSCKDLGSQCPAALIDYSTNKCFRLDRNTQGRDSDIIPYPTQSYFEQTCLRGATQACHGKAWAFERVVRHELLGFDDRVMTTVQSRRECEEACLKETSFVCRSAEYDYTAIECRLSKEDRRSRAVAFGPSTRNVDYLENQCLGADANCRLEKKEYATPSLVEFVQGQVRSEEECLNTCSAFRGFACRTLGFRPNTGECLISSDDHASAFNVFAEGHPETILFERTCTMSRAGQPFSGLPFTLPPVLPVPTVIVPPQLPSDTDDFNQLPTPQASSYLGGRCPSSTQGFIEYEKITGHVLKVDLMSTLVPNTEKRGITKECKDLCDLDGDCLAFNMDYNSSECISLRRDSTLNRHDLQMTEATGYFEPICFRSRGCGRIWTFERHLNKELRGHFKDTIKSVTKAECQERCLFEIRFPCRSAVYNHATSECRLSNEDRFSKPDSFAEADEMDYLENQCSNILTSRQSSNCQYTVMSRDRVLSFVDRVVQTASESECQRACDSELQFVCRSYSFTGSQDTRSPECYLSADTKDSVGAQLQNYPGASYVERVCPLPPFGPSIPKGPGIGPPISKPGPPLMGGLLPPPLPIGPGKYSPSVPGPIPPPFPGPGGYPGPGLYPVPPPYPNKGVAPYPQSIYPSPTGVVSNIYPSKQGGNPPLLPNHGPASPVSNQFPSAGSPGSASFPGYPNVYPAPYPGQNIPQQSFSSIGQHPGGALYPGSVPQSGSAPLPGKAAVPGSAIFPGSAPLPGSAPFPGSAPYPENAPYPGSASYPGNVPYPGSASYPGNLPYPGQPLPYPPVYPGPGRYPGPISRCDFSSDYIYEKTMGFAIRPLGRMEPLPASVTSQQMIGDCLRACTQDGSRCQAFMVQYPFSPSTTPCLSLDRGIGMERSQLLPRGDTAYFEKICVRSGTIAGKPCGKMWTFERVVGFQLDSSYEKEVRNMLTKEDCEEACLSEASLPCRSASYVYNLQLCRMSSETRRTRPEAFRYVGNDVDYLENQCAPEPSECEYTDLANKFNPFTDRLTVRVLTLEECKKSCDEEKEFVCRSISFDSQTNDCYLSAEDRLSTPAGPNIMIDRPGFTYAEKGGCGQVKVDCTQTEMLVTLRFGAPFSGRVYAKGNPQLCFIPGNSQTQLTMNIPIGTQCGTVEESQGRYANEIVIQQHPVIMTDHDKTYRVVCSFDMADKTLTFSPGGGGAIDVTYGIPRLGGPPPLIANTAPTPNVRLRITDRSGQDVTAVNLGDELYFRIEPDPYSAFGVFAKNLVARSEFLDYLPLLDNSGCPTDPNVFPSLDMERGTRALTGPFKAFRFASTGRVNFEVQIQFCQDACQSGRCQYGSTFGRRKRNDFHREEGHEEIALTSTLKGESNPEDEKELVSSEFTEVKSVEISTLLSSDFVLGDEPKINEANATAEEVEQLVGSDQTDEPSRTEPNPVSSMPLTALEDPQNGDATQVTEKTILNFPTGRNCDEAQESNEGGCAKLPSEIMAEGLIPMARTAEFITEKIVPPIVSSDDNYFAREPLRGNFNEGTLPSESHQQPGIFHWPQASAPHGSAIPNNPIQLSPTKNNRPLATVSPRPTTKTSNMKVEEDSFKMNKGLLPTEIPLRLSLTVAGDVDSDRRSNPITVNEGNPFNTDILGTGSRNNFNKASGVEHALPDFICSPKSTVIASIACIILIHLVVICGATVWCRRRFRSKASMKEEDILCSMPVAPSRSAKSSHGGANRPVFYRPSPPDGAFRGNEFYNCFPSALHHSPIAMDPTHWVSQTNPSPTNLQDTSEEI